MPKAATPARKRTTATKKTAMTVVPDPPERTTDPEPDEDPTESWFAELEDVEDHVNALFYGREGSTKTTSLARMSTMGRVLVINAEGGLKVAPLLKRGAVKENLKIWPRPGSGVKITHRALNKLYFKVKAELAQDPDAWFCIGFDSITEVYQALLDDVQQTRVQRLKEKTGGEVDEFFVDISDYGTMSKMVRDLLRKFRDLPCHVVFTALERRDVDPNTKKVQYGPDITPALQKDLLGYPDFVLMFKAPDEDGPARALTRSNSLYRAKDRFGVLPRVLAEPMGDRIIGYISGDLTEDTDPFQDDLPSSAKKAQDRQVYSDPDEEEDGSEPDGDE